MKSLRIEDVTLNGEKVHIFIQDGVIKEISQDKKEAEQVIKAQGLTAIPSLVDMQVHFREPGFEYKETIESGSLAAAAGGFTQVAIMPNTNPVIDNAETLHWVQEKIKETSKVDVHIIPAMTKGLKGNLLANFQEYKNLGVTAITDDGHGVQNDFVMEDIFKTASKLKLSILQHCEVNSLSEGAPIHQGKYASQNKIKGSPGESEWMMIERDLAMLKRYGGHYHVLHVSSKKSVELVRQAKKDGMNVTCEVTPHHLFLCDEDIKDSNFKMNPPLRSKEDQEALIEAFLDGTIDIVSTDHAPHSKEEKEKNLYDSPFGVIGLETAFPLLYSYLVLERKASLDFVVKAMAKKPREIFNLKGGLIQEGETADLTLINTETLKEVNKESFYSKSENSPFIGHQLKGWPEYTIKSGEVIYAR